MKPFGKTYKVLNNPNGIVSSSPGLRGTSYPGLIARNYFQPQRGWVADDSSGPQPRWGCVHLRVFPKVARASQPWALSRNPFGIHRMLRSRASVLDCGGKRSATPLSHGRGAANFFTRSVRSKAVSPLRSATALQDLADFRFTFYSSRITL